MCATGGKSTSSRDIADSRSSSTAAADAIACAAVNAMTPPRGGFVAQQVAPESTVRQTGRSLLIRSDDQGLASRVKGDLASGCTSTREGGAASSNQPGGDR
jgi:hypothetical protein